MSNTQPMAAFHICSDDVVARRLDDVVILINLKTNRIFELNSTGARLWELMSAGSTVSQIHDAIHDEFDVTDGELTRAIDTLAGWLAAEGLIASRDAS